jgi:DNA-binding transcriptional LysR family regulator
VVDPKSVGRYLRRVNLNLLPILLFLLRSRSVTRVATELGLSQPAVSDALSRLRQQFGDPLLVRIGGGMQLTSYAHELVAPLEQICAGLEGFLLPPQFDLRIIERELVVATSDFGGFLLARPMVALLQQEAPAMSLHLIEIEHDLTQKMASRRIDFAILPQFAMDDLAPAPLRFAPLVPVDTVVLMRRGHPLSVETAITDAALNAYPHIVFQPDAVLPEAGRIYTARFGFQAPVSARVAQMLLVPFLVLESDSLAIVPRQLADAMTLVHSLESRDFFSGRLKTAMGICWSPVFDGDRAHQWFRDSIISRFEPAG